MTASKSFGSAGHVGTSFRRAVGSRWRAVTKRQPADSDEAGFTLAEVIVSIAMFTVISISVMLALVTLVKYTAVTQNRVAAANLARQEIEKIRLQNSTVSQLDSGAATVSLKGTIYTVTPTMSPAANAGCAAGATRNVTVTVTWNNSGSRSVRYDTVLSC
jgi:type II secretory pathway pseudopilin PulG